MSMPILLLNAGSSSIKYQVIDAEDETVLATGLIERIGEASSTIKHKTQGETFEAADRYADHTEALAALVAMFDAHGPRLWPTCRRWGIGRCTAARSSTGRCSSTTR